VSKQQFVSFGISLGHDYIIRESESAFVGNRQPEQSPGSGQTQAVLEFALCREEEIAMKKILDYPNGPVFVEDRWSDIRVKVWHGKRSNDLHLTAQAARRLAFVLLLEAEKLEASKVHGLVLPKTLARSIERAIDAVARFHLADAKLRNRMEDREGQQLIRRMEMQGRKGTA
jgi:hypothetical protein